jgi:nitrate reductase beta subunit
MVWYVPPLSPVVDAVTASGSDGENHKVLLSAISQMRIPMEYLAGLFTAGDTAPVEKSLRRLAAMRSYMRDVFMGGDADESIPAAVGMTGEDVRAMYRLLSIAKYQDRYVIPTTRTGMPRGITELEDCPVSYDAELFAGGLPGAANPAGSINPAGAVAGTRTLPLEVI